VLKDLAWLEFVKIAAILRASYSLQVYRNLGGDILLLRQFQG
jgi:hypothetical protein